MQRPTPTPATARRRVWDNDGEFLLIEAAYALPRWLKPGTAENRVWLHGGSVHVVPPPRHAGDGRLGPTPSLAQALAAVASPEVDTAAPPKVLAALQPRLAGYPQRAAEQVHVARAVVPPAVAHLLHAEPQLVAAAVEAFYYRDLDDARAAARMAAFPPGGSLVPARVAFSRCLYAQAALQEFAVPRGYPLPLPSDPQVRGGGGQASRSSVPECIGSRSMTDPLPPGGFPAVQGSGAGHEVDRRV